MKQGDVLKILRFASFSLLLIGVIVLAFYLTSHFQLTIIVLPVALLWVWHGYKISVLIEKVSTLELRLQEVDKDALSARLQISNSLHGAAEGRSIAEV